MAAQGEYKAKTGEPSNASIFQSPLGIGPQAVFGVEGTQRSREGVTAMRDRSSGPEGRCDGHSRS